jgi:hypothetical protein
MRDLTDNDLRRALRRLGFTGSVLPLSISSCVKHPDRPGEYELLERQGERRRAALVRLKAWAANGEAK